MPAIPDLILKRLYIMGSLRNTPEGCQFALKNAFGTATVTRFEGIEVDGTVYVPQAVLVLVPDGGAHRSVTGRTAATITPDAPPSLSRG